MALCLVIDDERTFRVLAEEALRAAGHEVQTAGTGAAGLHAWKTLGPDVVILDRNLPDADGLELLRNQRRGGSGTQDAHVILVTAYADVESAVEALKLGAYDYLTKPIQLVELTNTVRNAAEALRLQGHVNAVAHRDEAHRPTIEPCSSLAMRGVIELVEKVAQSPSTIVLIGGESGSGKQLIAELVHARTPRAAQSAFVDLNCAAVPEALLESELFGHERGAFTDAKEVKRGLFELAEGGTLFLDEIGELPPATQAKILKVLDAMTFRRVGSTRDRRANLRIIAATNRDLERDVEAGRFRLDLYHRLAVFQIEVPPLRQRQSDVLPLARHFLARLASKAGKHLRAFTPDAEAALLAYNYPGNVRELKNIVERAVVLEGDERVHVRSLLLRTSSAGLSRSTSASPTSGAHQDAQAADEPRDPFVDMFRNGVTPPTLEALERLYVARVLKHTGGNRAQAARVLDVSYPTIQKKIRDYNLTP